MPETLQKKVKTSASHTTRAPPQRVTLAGVTDLFKKATESDGIGLVKLLETSAHFLNKTIKIKAMGGKQEDTFEVSGDDTAVTRFISGLKGFWDSHTQGVRVVESAFVLVDQDPLLQVAIDCLHQVSGLHYTDIQAEIPGRHITEVAGKRNPDADNKRKKFWTLYFSKMEKFGYAAPDATATPHLIKGSPAYARQLSAAEIVDTDWSLSVCQKYADPRPCAVCFYPASNHVDLMKHVATAHVANASANSNTSAVPAAPFASTFTTKMFVNFEEPVVDVWAVVVLYNPVNSEFDQRDSRTVTRFWKHFDDAGGTKAEWEGHIVFLDLIPLLDSGKQTNLTSDDEEDSAEVAQAKNLHIFNPYICKRIEHYVAQAGGENFPVILCSGTSRKKASLVADLTANLPEGVLLYDCKCHPMATPAVNPIPEVLAQFLAQFRDNQGGNRA